jgi:hypothetical protein
MRRAAIAVLLGSLFITVAPATAAPLVSVSWSVAGGTFSGLSTGSVGGGSVSFTPFVPVTTPTTTLGVWSIYLFGTSAFNYFSAQFTSNAVLGATTVSGPPAILVSLGSFLTGSGAPQTTIAPPSFFFSANNAGGFGSVRGAAIFTGLFFQTITHQFTIQAGSEVRTLVPEPAPGLLVGFGLVLTALVGRRAGRAWGARSE